MLDDQLELAVVDLMRRNKLLEDKVITLEMSQADVADRLDFATKLVFAQDRELQVIRDQVNKLMGNE